MIATPTATILRKLRRLAAVGSLGLALGWSSAGIAVAAPPALPPVNFHPFGPPTPLIPDGAVVPLRPVRPVKTMSPLFMMPTSPFGQLGQNFGALGGAFPNEPTANSQAHRRPIVLTPPKVAVSAAAGAGAARGASSGSPGSAAIGTSRTPAHRRPLGW